MKKYRPICPACHEFMVESNQSSRFFCLHSFCPLGIDLDNLDERRFENIKPKKKRGNY